MLLSGCFVDAGAGNLRGVVMKNCLTSGIVPVEPLKAAISPQLRLV